MIHDSEALPATPERPTQKIDGGRIAGFSGCNRFSGAIKEPAPGEITIGTIGGPRMACSPPEMQLVDQYR